LDKKYYEKVSGASRQNFYGAPLSATVSLRGMF
jgi:outer membrane receptor for ferric coprogen and ferric-rhodotorulic acid